MDSLEALLVKCLMYQALYILLFKCTHTHTHTHTHQAGMQAVRENRYVILSKDFEKAYKKAIKKDDTEHEFYK